MSTGGKGTLTSGVDAHDEGRAEVYVNSVPEENPGSPISGLYDITVPEALRNQTSKASPVEFSYDLDGGTLSNLRVTAVGMRGRGQVNSAGDQITVNFPGSTDFEAGNLVHINTDYSPPGDWNDARVEFSQIGNEAGLLKEIL